MSFALVSMAAPLPSTPNLVSSRGFFQHVELQPGLLFIVYGENEYLQYSWIIFPHCSTVTAASQFRPTNVRSVTELSHIILSRFYLVFVTT